MAERGVLALCLQAPGETAAAVACAAVASALAVILTATSALTLPPPSPASAYPRGRPSKPLAGVWLPPGRGTELALNAGAEHCARAARQRTKL